MKLTASQAKYQPGEPVLVRATLANTRSEAQTLPELDHISVVFTVQPRLNDRLGDLKFIDPLFSSREATGKEVILPSAGPEKERSREFVFTTLSLERGTYVLEAVYTRPSNSPIRPASKTYARAVAIEVAGEKAYAHRYLNGLLAREDAVKLAAARAGAPVRSSDTLLIEDEAGFQKWWVNLTLAGSPGTVKSYFVDPYFACVWKEARPFTAADKGVEPPMAQDSQVLKKLREQGAQKRTR